MNYNEEFLSYINDINIEVTSSKEEIDSTYTLVMKKIRLNKKPKLGKKGMTLLILAAIIAASTISVVAYQLSIKESFPKVFNEQNSVGQIVPVEEKLPLVEQAGSYINQTVTQNDVKVTVNGVVGDSDTVYLSIDVEDITGKALQTEGGQLKFNSAYFHIDDGSEAGFYATGQYCWSERIDDGSIPSKATFLINEKTIVEDIIGKKATLVLTDLEELTSAKATDIEMTYDNVYDIYSQFETVKDEDFIEQAIPKESEKSTVNTPGFEHYFDNYPRNEKGEVIDGYALPYTDKEIAFSNKYPNTYVMNIGIKDKNLYILVTSSVEEEGKSFRDLALKNIVTGELIPLNGSSGSICYVDGGLEYGFTEPQKPNIYYSRFYFEGINSPEQLKDYVIETNAAINFQTVRKGEWRFDFDLSYQNTTKTFDVSSSCAIGEVNPVKFNISKIKISPISITVMGTSDDIIYDTPATIKMKDGSTVELSHCSSDTRDNNSSLKYIFPVVVDVDQVESVAVGDAVILIS